MSNYTKTVDFQAKDALASGDPLKLAKGTEVDDEFDAIAVAIATKADSASPTFTGTVTIPDGAAQTSAASVQQVQKGALAYAADGGASDAYAITLSPVPAAYLNGMVVNFKANTANTGAATLNVNSLGAITIKKHHDQDLANNDIEANQIVTVIYNSTGPVFEMQSQLANAAISVPASTIRQIVLGGTIDSSGYASFLPASGSGLTISSTGISSTVPFVVTAANGYGSSGSSDRAGQSTANITWGSLTDTATNYLYVDVDSGGVLTPGAVTLKPVYQWGGTYSTTNNQHTFNIQEMVMKVGNGSTASQVWRVFVGEAVCSGGNVASTVSYSYLGRYESGQLTLTVSSGMTATHKIGLIPKEYIAVGVAINTNNGYTAGDEAFLFTHDGTTAQGLSFWADPTTIGTTYPGFAAVINKSTGGTVLGITTTDWKIILRAWRGW